MQPLETTDHVKIPASELRTGDFIILSDEWPNGRSVFSVHHDCGGVDIMFKTCNDGTWYHDENIDPSSVIKISKTFSDRFND